MWDAIKKILEKQGGTCIIVEDGKPRYVVSGFEEYQKLIEEEKVLSRPASSLSDQELLEKINQDIAAWRLAQAEETAEAELPEEDSEGGIRIEDLPV